MPESTRVAPDRHHPDVCPDRLPRAIVVEVGETCIRESGAERAQLRQINRIFRAVVRACEKQYQPSLLPRSRMRTNRGYDRRQRLGRTRRNRRLFLAL